MSIMLAPRELDLPARTLARSVSLPGFGVHGGARATLTLSPTDEPGWWFESQGERAKVESAKLVAEHWQTAIVLPGGARMATVEHALAVLSGLHLDAVVLKLDGPEAPILDGSSKPILDAVLEAGLRELSWKRRAWALRETLRVEVEGRGWMEARPSEALTCRCVLDFDGALPESAREARWCALEEGFEVLAGARTFAFRAWVDKLRESGMIQGGSLACAVLFDEGKALNPGGLRSPNEPARHKLLDLIGDLALLGRPLLASFEVYRPGHHVHHSWLRALRETLQSHGEHP